MLFEPFLGTSERVKQIDGVVLHHVRPQGIGSAVGVGLLVHLEDIRCPVGLDNRPAWFVVSHAHALKYGRFTGAW